MNTKPFFKRVAAPALVLIVSGAVAWQFMATAPKASRSAPAPKVRLVDTYTVKQSDVSVTISGLGVIVPSQQVSLSSEVSGRISDIHIPLLPGSRFSEGDLLLNIDTKEYQILVEQQRALVAQAQSELQLEEGQQRIALQEYKLTGNKLSANEEALVLRQPQLNAAKASVKQAEAALDQAELNLARTRIVAPFDGQVVTRSVDIGSSVTNSSVLLDIVTTNTFWMELEIPAEQVQWLEFPEANQKGSPVELSSPAWGSETRAGEVLSLSPQLNSDSRMAKVIISIEDPLALEADNSGKPKVLVNDLLRARISGKQVADATAVPDELIRNGNQIWVLRDDCTLEIRSITPVYLDAEKAIITEGLEENEQLVSSSLTTPVNGLPLRTSEKPLVAGKTQ